MDLDELQTFIFQNITDTFRWKLDKFVEYRAKASQNDDIDTQHDINFAPAPGGIQASPSLDVLNARNDRCLERAEGIGENGENLERREEGTSDGFGGDGNEWSIEERVETLHLVENERRVGAPSDIAPEYRTVHHLNVDSDRGGGKGGVGGTEELGNASFGQHNDYSYSTCLLYTSPSPRDQRGSRMPSSA